jgi:uncharacterized protein (DUF1015 family)
MSASDVAPRPDGLVLSPFRALRYAAHLTGDLDALTSPPYDVIDPAGLEALERASEHNVVRLILPRDARAEGDRYERAAALLEQWRTAGVLHPDPEPALYVYEQASATHTQRGLLGALALSPPDDGIVLPHENTMSGTVSDRLSLYTAVDADLEPIFLLYDGGGATTDAVAQASDREPLVDVELPDGLRHRLWALTDPALLAQIAEDLHTRKAVIADGHHRYATYLQRQAAAHAAGRGPGAWDYGLTFLVDSTSFGPEVHAIHRYLPGQDAADLAERAAAAMQTHDLDGQDLESALSALEQAGPRSFLLVSGDGGTLRLLTQADPGRLAAALPTARTQAWRDLDVSVLHHVLVEDVWGLTDDISTVGYEHDVAGAIAAARASDGTAVLLNPTPLAAVAEVAGGGERMPRKSTLFTPKPRTGLVIRDHRDA